ncbi:MAG: tryptophan synthase subunit alpha [Verrucomicrobiales bacterium]|nr:tryptophan synthase subunit alpha [Verrucomicrobiales bacterium]
MNRIDAAFANLRAAGKKAFIAYVCAGDPTLERTVEIVRTLEACGVDVIELGVPFSDPLADGVVNQMAAQRALDGGATVLGVIELIRRIRQHSQVPLVLFTYLNPVYAHGFEEFHRKAAEAGADGILLLDLPPDEQACNRELPRMAELQRIRLIAPTTPPERAKEIAALGEGFLYYISREGVTGEQQSLAANLEEQAAAIKAASPVPVCVGFGISTPQQAAAVARAADGVVVGSAIVRIIERHGQSADLSARLDAFVRPLVAAVKSA